jgi:hypothetical protein
MPRADLCRLGAVVLLAGLAGGCVQDRYFDRRDQITFGSGDATAANKVLQIIDPWPVQARTIHQGISGEQAEAVMDKFRKRASGQDITAAPAPVLNFSSAPTAAPKP